MSSPTPVDPARKLAVPIGVLLTNVGTPASPTTKDVRPYLAQFLGDRRIIDLPRWLWMPILHGPILMTRPKRSARLYQNVWSDEGSPLLVTLRKQGVGLQTILDERLDPSTPPVRVAIGMGYGSPSIPEGLVKLLEAGAQRILVLPLFPQYSTTTTAASLDVVFDALRQQPWMPEVRTVNGYHDDEGYLTALERSIREHWQNQGRAERLLFSYHGIPKRYSERGEPYYAQCQETTRLLAARLGLAEGEWAVSFQSRFGPIEWLRPYTDELLEEWGAAGLGSVDVVCPGFSADCLETIDEIAREARESFQAAGGGDFHYIPALNDRPDHLNALADMVIKQLQGWLE